MAENENGKNNKVDKTTTISGEDFNLDGATPSGIDPPIGELAYAKAQKNEKEISSLRSRLSNPQWSNNIIRSINTLSYFIKFIIVLIFISILISSIVFLCIVYMQLSVLINVLEAIRDSKISSGTSLKEFESFYFISEKWIKAYALGFFGLSGISALGWFILKCISRINKK